MEYLSTIGLEIHAELKTKTKMFCASKNDPDETRPNVNVCPVCLGHPGTLPVVNKEAVKHVLKVGFAVGGTLADFTEFDRKNYFYPDIPKGYQISQYKYPLVRGGELKGVRLTRIHLEEDTGTSYHDRGEGSLVDFNRAGVPLMELVTEPVIHTAKDAAAFARELQLILRYLGVSDANMEKGEMRVEANVSVGSGGKLGTKAEIKNLNSFRSVERAIEYEILRQTKLLQSGGTVAQETRGWNEGKGTTFSQRQKEESHDYRYFPDPDIPKLSVSEVPEFAMGTLSREIPELPAAKRARLQGDYRLKAEDAEMYVQNLDLGRFFEETARLLREKDLVLLASNYVTSDMVGYARDGGGGEAGTGKVTSVSLAELIRMLKGGEISSRGAKNVLKIIFKEGGSARKIADARGLHQQSDEKALQSVVQKIITANQKVVVEYKGGKTASLQFLVGQAMKETRGAGNPQTLRKIFEEVLKK